MSTGHNELIATDTSPSIDRSAAFSGGPPKISRKTIVIAVAVVLLLGLGGSLLERTIENAERQPTPAPRSTMTTLPGTPPSIDASLASFLGLQSLNREAPGFTLSNVEGVPVTLAAMKGRVVVLSFFESRCTDICHVLAAELHVAADRVRHQSDVSWLTVNADPIATSLASARVAVRRSGLGDLGGWQFLTGSLSRLNAVWRAYGVTIDVQPATGRVAHNEVLLVIGGDGRTRYRLTPFADEASNGRYSISRADIARFGDGLASLVNTLAR